MKIIIEKIEVGTQFWDGRYGPFVCTQKPEFQKVNDGQDEGYFWLGKDSYGSVCEFLWIEKYSHYGPKVYLEQEYFSPEELKKGDVKMIELDDDWVSCHDKSGNRAYFPYNKIHPDYTQDGYVLVTAKEFLDYFDCVDSTYDDSYFQTYDYFKHLHIGKEVEFEDIHICKDTLQDMVINALLNDNYRCQVFTRSYDDWEFIVSLDTLMVMDGNFYCDYTVDHILKELGLPDLYTLQADFDTNDIEIENEYTNPYPIMKTLKDGLK